MEDKNKNNECYYEIMLGAIIDEEPAVYRCARHIGARIFVAERTQDTPRRISGVVFGGLVSLRSDEPKCRMIPDHHENYEYSATG